MENRASAPRSLGVERLIYVGDTEPGAVAPAPALTNAQMGLGVLGLAVALFGGKHTLARAAGAVTATVVGIGYGVSRGWVRTV